MVELLLTSSIISSHPRKKGGNLFPASDTPPSNYFNMAAKRPPGTPGKIISWFRNFLVGVRTKYDNIDLDACLNLFVSLNYSFFKCFVLFTEVSCCFSLVKNYRCMFNTVCHNICLV